jgi:hypothetical protein
MCELHCVPVHDNTVEVVGTTANGNWIVGVDNVTGVKTHYDHGIFANAGNFTVAVSSRRIFPDLGYFIGHGSNTIIHGINQHYSTVSRSTIPSGTLPRKVGI